MRKIARHVAASGDSRSGDLAVFCFPRPDDIRLTNPYLRLLKGALGRAGVSYRGGYANLWSGNFSLVHVHWPEAIARHRWLSHALVKCAILLGGLTLAWLRGRPIIWTAHNLHAHESGPRPKFERMVWRLFERMLSGTIFMTEMSAELGKTIFPELQGKPQIVIPHGHYRDVAGTVPRRQEARARLGLQQAAQVVSFFGTIRPYKGIVELVNAFRNAELENARLLIGGDLARKINSAAFVEDIQRAMTVDGRIATYLHTLPNAELIDIVGACDLVVLPYWGVHNSGAVFFALSCDRPVCAPRLGGLPELRSHVGADWLYLYDPPFTAKTLEGALSWAKQDRRGQAPNLDMFDWDTIARSHKAFFEDVIKLADASK